MERVTVGEVVFYRFGIFANGQHAPLKHGVFTRLGGVSVAPWGPLNLGGNVGDDPQAVDENYRRVFEALAANAERACSVWQVHGSDTVIVNGPIPGRRWVALADGMVTAQPDTPLVMRYADCTPILFYDPVQSVIGMAHAGWRGTVKGAGVNELRVMVDAFGCDVRNIQAGIGPSIGPDCYQVGEEVVEAVADYFENTEGLIARDPADGTAYLNLWQANALDLQRAGVEHIEIAGICTATRTDEFHSHRAEKGRTGRFAAVMSL